VTKTEPSGNIAIIRWVGSEMLAPNASHFKRFLEKYFPHITGKINQELLE
jgi:hypothetical protein